MRFLVTGSNGLVGSRVCALLEKEGHEVVGLGRGPRRAAGAYRYAQCELTNEQEVAATLAGAAPEVVIHTACMTEVDACERDPEQAYAANVTASAAVARGARKSNAHLVYVSTDYVFDGHQAPYDEQSATNPLGIYALTKHMGEQASRVFVPGCAVARTGAVYGWPAAARPNFGSWLVGALEKGQRVNLFQDQFISASFADSLAAMLVELGERKLGGIWNTCGADIVDRVHFGRSLCEAFGFDPGLINSTRLADMKLASPRPLHSGLKVDKVRDQLRTQPLSLTESMSRFHAIWKAGKSS